MNEFKEAIDVVDASIFSGDALHSEVNREFFKSILARWTRELETMDAVSEDSYT